MSFQNQKKVFLSKADKSKKGSIDKRIRKLVDAINRTGSYYTTSSCSGRIVLLREAEANRKNESEWLFSSHEKAKFGELKKALGTARLPKETVWFKFEGMILHVCCRTVEDAAKLLNAARAAGLKHSGICSISKKITVEIMDSEHFDLPVSKKGRLLVDDPYLRAVLAETNKKLERTWGRITKLEDIIKGMKE